MMRSNRDLHVEALDALRRQKMAALVKAKDWDLLREVAALANSDAPVDLATTDPSLYRAWRDAVTQFHIDGWSNMTPERIVELTRHSNAAE